MNQTQIKLQVKSKTEVSGEVEVERVVVPFEYHDSKGNITISAFEAYRISATEFLFNKIEKFLEFYGLDDLPRIKESELLGCGQAFTLWILKDYWLVRAEIVRTMFLKLFANEIRAKVKEISEMTIDNEEMKEELFNLASYYRSILEDKYLCALYIIAKLYWSEVKREDPCWVCKVPRVRLLLTQSE